MNLSIQMLLHTCLTMPKPPAAENQGLQRTHWCVDDAGLETLQIPHEPKCPSSLVVPEECMLEWSEWTSPTSSAAFPASSPHIGFFKCLNFAS